MPISILIVDDSEDFRDALADLLVEEGMRPFSASSGEDAILILEAGPRPDVVILDLIMPGMDGRAFLGELDARGMKSVPVLLLTGMDARAAMRAGTDGLVDRLETMEKTADPGKILEAVRGLAKPA